MLVHVRASVRCVDNVLVYTLYANVMLFLFTRPEICIHTEGGLSALLPLSPRQLSNGHVDPNNYNSMLHPDTVLRIIHPTTTLWCMPIPY